MFSSQDKVVWVPEETGSQARALSISALHWLCLEESTRLIDTCKLEVAS